MLFDYAITARKTHCKNGHEFTPENTRIRPGGRRLCRECSRIWGRAHPRVGRYTPEAKRTTIERKRIRAMKQGA